MRHTIAYAVLLATAAANKELDKAIEDNNAAMVNLALKSGAKANSVDDDGETPLLRAVRKDKSKALKSLLKHKADLQVVDKAGYNALHIAAAVGASRSLQVLMTAGLSPFEHSEVDGLAPLHRAVLSGSTDTAKVLLNAEVPMDQPTKEEVPRTPMQLAEMNDHLEMKGVLEKFSRAKAEL